MSSIGKVFVVVNLVLSLVLLGSMGSLLEASKSTKDDVTRLEQEKSELQSQLSAAQSEADNARRTAEADKQRLREEKSVLEDEKASLARTNQRLEGDSQALNTSYAKLSADLAVLTGSVEAKDTRNRELQNDNDDLRKQAMDARDAQRDAELAARDLRDQIVSYEARLSTLGDQLTDATEEARKNARLVEVAVNAGFDPYAVVAPPAIDAVVMEVDKDYDFVILDKGAEDEVSKGIVFDIYRGNTFVGQVKVDMVQPKQCTAKILLKSGNDFMRLDRATTRL